MNIEVKNLTHKYNEGLTFETVALNHVSFNIKAGEFAAFIGHTGSGKSTMAQQLVGLIKPTSGEILADGINIHEKNNDALYLRRKIGIVFQYPEYQLFEESVLKDVMFGPKNMGLSEEASKLRAKHALNLVGIDSEEKWEASPFSLSGGEKRRVAIAGVLAMDPEVLILDEPAAGLDPQGLDDIFNMIARIKADRNLTIILISHDMDDVAYFADHIIVLNKGKKTMDGTADEVFGNGKDLMSIGLGVPRATQFLIKLNDKFIENGKEKKLGIAAMNIKDAAAELIEKI